VQTDCRSLARAMSADVLPPLHRPGTPIPQAFFPPIQEEVVPSPNSGCEELTDTDSESDPTSDGEDPLRASQGKKRYPSPGSEWEVHDDGTKFTLKNLVEHWTFTFQHTKRGRPDRACKLLSTKDLLESLSIPCRCRDQCAPTLNKQQLMLQRGIYLTHPSEKDKTRWIVGELMRCGSNLDVQGSTLLIH
jgi:hypothetical protein